MKSIYIGVGVLVVAAAVLVGVYGKGLFNKPASISDAINNQNQEQSQNQANNQTIDTVNPSGSYSINELFTLNKPMKCTWKESITNGAEVTNILFINGNKFYQDVTMGDIGHAYTISDSQYLYIWNDFSGVASKMKLADVNNTSIESGQEKTSNSAALEQKRDFVCENWSVDVSLFNPPQGKNFQDVTEEMQQVTQQLGEGGLEKARQQACDLCQSAPSEMREECLKNAQCN